MTKYRSVFFLLLLMTFATVFSVQGQEKNSLTILLESCFENNPELKAAFHRWQAADSAIIHKTAIPDPVVNFRHNTEPIQTRIGAQKQVLTVSQMLPYPGKQKTAIRLNHLLADNDRFLYEAKFRDLMVEVKKSYAEVWFLQRAIKLAEANNGLLEFMLKETVANLSSPTLAPVLRAQSQLAQSANDIINYSELLEAEKARMRALTHREELPPEWFVEIPVLQIPEQNNDLLQQTLQNRIEIKSAENARNISVTKLKLANFDNKPDFTLGYSRSYTGNRPDLNNVYLKGEGKDAIGFFVQLNLPVWENKNRSRIGEAREKKSEANAMFKAKEDETRANFFKLWFNLANRKRLNQLYIQTILPQAERAVESAQSVFQADNAKYSDYLETVATVYAIRIAAWRAEADCFISACELEKWTGTPFSLQNREKQQ